VRVIIQDLIEDGLDMLDPIQIRAAGMDMPSLVRDFGDKLCFHGGVDTQHTLPFCGAEEVRTLVRGFRDLTRDTGGYVMTGSQELIEDIPLDNILAMYDENMRAH
jgi:uroporphyrinogen decarboxylase